MNSSRALSKLVLQKPSFRRAIRRMLETGRPNGHETALCLGPKPEQKTLPTEPSIRLPEPIGDMHENFRFEEREMITPKPWTASRVKGGLAYWDGINFLPFVDDVPPDATSRTGFFLPVSEKKKKQGLRTLEFNRPIVLVGAPGRTSFYHWMIDTAPQVGAAIELFPELSDFDICCNASGQKFQIDSLKLISPETKIHTPTPPVILRAPEIVHVESDNSESANRLGKRVPEWVVEFWKKHKSEDKAGFGPRIFLSRRATDGRNVEPIDAVEDHLKERGFEVVYIEDFDLQVQFNIFSDAKIVVAPHGAGLTHAMFMRPGSVLVELFSDHLVPCFRYLAGRAGAHYIPVSMNSRIDDLRKRDRAARDKTRRVPIFVDFERLEKSLNLAVNACSIMDQ